jgi:histidyl-tRNA synthetase
MKDILPAQAWRWQRLEQEFRDVAELRGFAEIRTPLIEPTELFVRQIGADTDVVEKEMYSFDRHGDALTVRPEGTAGAARAYVQHSVQAVEPVTRWYYLGPMFRAERPAKGRYRQFFQAGCEHFGDAGPASDAEMIHMAAEIVERLGIKDYAIHVNSLGSAEARLRFRDALRAHFAPLAGELSEDSRRRLDANPLRILDSKAPQDASAIASAPSILELLAGEDAEHFDRLRAMLDRLGVRYRVDPKLVRGLDYYTRTLFELKTTTGELGAQSALLGGGRYDGMVESLGGPHVPAIGFAMGIERLLELMPEGVAPGGPEAYLVPMGAAAQVEALVLASDLRAARIRCEVDGRGLSLRAMLRRANAVGARCCLLLGADEIARGAVTLKDLARHEQVDVALPEVARTLLARRDLSPAVGPGPSSGDAGSEASSVDA